MCPLAKTRKCQQLHRLNRKQFLEVAMGSKVSSGKMAAAASRVVQVNILG